MSNTRGSVDQALKQFSILEKAGGRWKGNRGNQHPHEGLQRSSAGRQSLVYRREAFLKQMKRDEDEQREIQLKKQKAAEMVAKALAVKNNEAHHARPLRRFKVRVA